MARTITHDLQFDVYMLEETERQPYDRENV